MGIVVRRYIDILRIIINFPYSTCIYRIAGIFRGGKFSRKPLQLYY